MTETRSLPATACVVGCGPAGAMLGLVLARAGISEGVCDR
jgi:2-polyprenyl-6-methoxyphenol hydroxylase-like FAD-dependent oxidoreductase